MLKMQLMPRRRDPRLVFGSALLTAQSGNLVRVEGRLSKSPSFWVRSVNVSRSYSPIGGAMMPVAIESTADVRIAGMSVFSMTYDYQTVDGQAVNARRRPLASSLSPSFPFSLIRLALRGIMLETCLAFSSS